MTITTPEDAVTPTAQGLADLLRTLAQASASNQVALNDANLGTTGLDALVQADLRRSDGTLNLIINPSAIPANPPSSGFTVPATVPSGDDGFLSLDGRDASLQLLVGSGVDLVLTVQANKVSGATVDWVFSDSFPEIAFQPYDALTIASPLLILSTGATGTPDKGLDFTGSLALNGIFQAAATLLGVASSYPLAGPLTGSGDTFAFDFMSSFGLPDKTIGDAIQFSLSDTGAGVSLTPVTKDGVTEKLIAIYLAGKVAVQNSSGTKIELDARAGMPLNNPTSPMLMLSVFSEPGFEATLGSLGALVAGQNWNAFFSGPASSIGDLLDKFGLKSYAVTINLTTLSVNSMSLDVGTLSPWPMWSGGPTLDIDVAWNLTYLGSNSISYVLLTADFSYPPQSKQPLTFELSIDSDLNITGVEKGALPPLKLSDLNTEIFGGNLVIPDDLLTVQVSDFTFAASVGTSTKTFSIAAIANADVTLFGASVLGVRNMALAVSFNAESEAPTTYTGKLSGQVYLGPITLQADATISNAKDVDTVFQLHLVNETVGSMLNHFAHLIDPTYDISFGDPWDKFLDISLDAFVLEINVSKGSVSLSYEPPSSIDLVFLTITKVSLTYTQAAGGQPSSTKVEVSGTFLGVPFPGNGNDALSWDPVNENPPAVPGKGSSVFDLEYAGLGQHISLGENPPTTMDAVMAKLRASAGPAQPGALPPFGTDLVFAKNSSWLIGAQFTVIDTVSIKAIFNDPDLYGVVLELSGEKAAVFAGLRFEILYRKVTDTIGVYHIELKLPDAMRHLEFGEVSVTLPVVDLDIYTNGNFRVDFGFPKGLDFSNSFSVQVFPFVGYGGFYFALLDGATSNRVPAITNGSFSPVIEFGVALSIGVGKTIDEGILSGGLSVTVVGILEGVLGWFNPTDSSPSEVYHWIKGTIAVTGRLYASIDFAIIQASVDVTAYLSATLVIESHQPIYISASASVSVRVSVKIIFFTIHLSFSATINASFTIGSASPTPWILAAGGPSSNGVQRMLTGQRTLHTTARSLHPGLLRANRRALIAASGVPSITSWPAVCVLAQGKQVLPVQALTAFTKAESWPVASAVRASNVITVTTAGAHDFDAGDPVTLAGLSDGSFNGSFSVSSVTGNVSFTVAQNGPDGSTSGGTAWAAGQAGSAESVLLLMVQTSVPPSAYTLAEHRLLAGTDPSSIAFNLLMEAMLGWGIYVSINRTLSGSVRASGVSTLQTSSQHSFTVGTPITVSGVADPSFNGSFTVTAVPGPTSISYQQTRQPDGTSTGGQVAGSVISAEQLDLLRQQLSDPDTVAAAFDYGNLTQFLAANFTFDVAVADTDTPTSGALFPMVPALSLSDSIGTAVNFGSHTEVDDNYVAKIRAYFTLLQLQFAAANAGQPVQAENVADSSVSMATLLFTQYFQMLLTNGVKAAADYLASYPYTTGSSAMSFAEVASAIGDTMLLEQPSRLVTPSQDLAILAAGASISLPDVVRQIRSGDSFTSIAAALATAGAQGASGAYAASDLLSANSQAAVFDTGVAFPLAGLPYTTGAGDTVNLVATRVLVRVGGTAMLTGLAGLQQQVAALQASNPTITDPNQVLDVGTVVALPAGGGNYTSVVGDTLTLVAGYQLAVSSGQIDLASYVAALQAANSWLPSDPTSPLPVGRTVLLATLSRPMAGGDTIQTLASTLMTTEAAIGTALLGLTTPVLFPTATLHAPLSYLVKAGDTFSAIAASFDVTLDYLAGQAAETSGLFAPSVNLTVSDVGSISPAGLLTGLVNSAAWNTAAGMVSRFLMSGIRLPDPSDTSFAGLTPQQLLNPANLAGIRTKPSFVLTGQQYPIGTSAPANYQLTLTNTGQVPWLTLAGSASQPLQFGLSANQQTLLTNIATTALSPGIESVSRLELFQMAPPRIVLQTHLAWQAALPPVGCFPAASAAGGPSVWMFPDALVASLADQQAANANTALSPQILVSAKHVQADQPVVATEAGCYSWATLVNFSISLPVTDGSAASVANAYVVDGADDTGAALLQQLQARVAAGDTATLYLLYPPDPASPNASGLASDVLNPTGTYLLKTNLSTLTHSGADQFNMLLAAPDPTQVYAATLADPADFLAVLWEASITRSGGFYLNYVNSNGGTGLPPTVFGSSSTAQLSLLVLLQSQNGRWAILPGPGIQRVNGVSTADTAVAHGLTVGAQVSITDVADASFNGSFTVTAVPNASSFSYAQAGLANAASGGGSAAVGNASWPIMPAPAANTPNGAQRTGGVSTISTSCVHGLAVGAQVSVAGVADASFNGSFTVTAVPNPGAFSYAQAGPDAVSGDGSANAGSSPVPAAGMLGFNNCAVVGDSIDPASNLFVQPATVAVGTNDTLASLAQAFDTRWGTGLATSDLAVLNASVPLLLRVGGSMLVPGQPNYSIEYGDTFDSVVATLAGQGVQTSVAQLGTANANAAILAPGAQAQFALNTLAPATTVPPGVSGFSITRTNPDPGIDYDQLSPSQLVSSLFNLLGWTITGAGAFTASGAGLATTPTEQSLTTADGLTPLDPDDTDNANWYYQQAIAIAPFGKPAQPAVSPALPAIASNPYNGVGQTGGALNQITLALNLQDVYGNSQPMPAGEQTLAIPVGYYDVLSGPASWPSLAISYQIGGSLVAVTLDMTMQQTRYIPSGSVTVSSAQASIAADLQSYTGIFYQLVQPDVSFTLQTTLAQDSGGKPVSYPVPKQPMLAFAAGAYVYLGALSTLTAVTEQAGSGGLAMSALMAQYGVTAGQLFAANQTQLYETLFGSAKLTVPLPYTTVQSDSLDSISSKNNNVPVGTLATLNSDVPLNPGADLAAGSRTVPAVQQPNSVPASLASVAGVAHASPAAIAVANAPSTTILLQGTVLNLGTNSYTLGQNDSFANAASKLNGTVAQLAQANSAVPIFVTDAPLTVTDVQVNTGDTLTSLAAITGVGTVASLAAANAGLANLFAPTTTVVVGTQATPPAPLPSDTLASYATACTLSLDLLASSNASSASFADGAVLSIPGVFANTAGQQFCTYTAPSSATVDSIAALFGSTAAVINQLNPTPPGPGGLWICPPMRGDAFGQNSAGSLAGLAKAYNADVTALATANAATLEVLAEQVTVTVSSVSYQTQANDTLNSLVNRFADKNVATTVADLITALQDVPKLIAPNAAIVPVPPPSPGESIDITPGWTAAVFPITVTLTESRDPALVDPDFATASTVLSSSLSLAPDPGSDDSGAAFSLVQFASQLEAALPGLHVATGDPAAEDDPASASAVWAVNFGDSAAGPTIGYQFDAANTGYFALPPMSPSLMAGDLPLIPYVTGQQPPFSGSSQTRTFRAVDLDRWLESFLAAVDQFLSPAYAVPAYGVSAASVLAILQNKQQLAELISRRVTTVLAGGSGNPATAADALYQSMLTTLSTAFTVDTLIQVPVTVTSSATDPKSAPRLSGSAVAPGSSQDAGAQAYSFSTAKVQLTNGPSEANFLFSVKAAADHREVSLDLNYVVTELELPDPAETIGDYEGSYWLKFVNPVPTTGSGMPGLVIPVPLRAYPGPVTLVAQQATQSVAAPASAADLLPWDLSFVYQHDDAEQDTPFVEIAFNTTPDAGPFFSVGADPVLTNVFAALAQFSYAWPDLKNDLALLINLPPGTTNPTVLAAVDAFTVLVGQVAGAFVPPSMLSEEFVPPAQILGYQLQKEQTTSAGGAPTLTNLVITESTPQNGAPKPQLLAGAPPLWPSAVVATYQGTDYPLTLVSSSASSIVFGYPAGVIPADAQISQRFSFSWPGGNVRSGDVPSIFGADLIGPQTFEFLGVNVLDQQAARAGVSISRNLELVQGSTTNPAFVYRTPVTSFTASAVPAISGSQPIAIGANPTPVGQALGEFLKVLFTSANSWTAGDTVTIRFTGGYSYAIAATGPDTLGPVVPIFLVASVDFNPLADWDWTSPSSFVSQVQAVVDNWISTQAPVTDNAALQFGLTVYASGGQLQSLIRDVALSYQLTGS